MRKGAWCWSLVEVAAALQSPRGPCFPATSATRFQTPGLIYGYLPMDTPPLQHKRPTGPAGDCQPACCHRAWRRAGAFIVWPVAAFLSSPYERAWDGDALAWRQSVQHSQAVTGVRISVESLLTAQLGCTSLSAELSGVRYVFTATSAFQPADIGVSGWESPL
jgi:hypothetical protein